MVYWLSLTRDNRASAVVVEIVFVLGSKSRTESMMMADLLAGSAMMYCQVDVLGSKMGWMVGSWGGVIWKV